MGMISFSTIILKTLLLAHAQYAYQKQNVQIMITKFLWC